jgi:REP-associated tyrosine transposase
MARRPRICIPGLTHHVVQRGNNKETMFGDEADHRFFLKLLQYESARCAVAIHAYALMRNHFHLMATPGDQIGLSTMMQSLGRTYVPAYNLKHNRTGGLWEGRYRSFVIENESYWLTCMRYVELNPVRAGIVPKSDDYCWSSARAHMCGCDDPMLACHELYLRLGETSVARQRAWRSICGEAISDSELAQVRDATRRGRWESDVQNGEGV